MTNEEIAQELHGVSITDIATGLLRLDKSALAEYIKDKAKAVRVSPLDLPENERKKEFGSRLKMMRELRGLTQTEVAKQLGVHKSSLSNWEAGRLEPSQRALITLAVILNVQTDWLLDVPPLQPEHIQ